MSRKLLSRCNPNKLGYVSLWLADADPASDDWSPEWVAYVEYPVPLDSDWQEVEWNTADFQTLEAARLFYRETVAQLNRTPNWAAQAAYDEES